MCVFVCMLFIFLSPSIICVCVCARMCVLSLTLFTCVCVHVCGGWGGGRGEWGVEWLHIYFSFSLSKLNLGMRSLQRASALTLMNLE